MIIEINGKYYQLVRRKDGTVYIRKMPFTIYNPSKLQRYNRERFAKYAYELFGTKGKAYHKGVIMQKFNKKIAERIKRSVYPDEMRKEKERMLERKMMNRIAFIEATGMTPEEFASSLGILPKRIQIRKALIKMAKEKEKIISQL